MIKCHVALIGTFMGAAVCAAPAPVSDVTSGSLESRMAALERMVDARTNAQHSVQAQLDQVQNEVNDLRGVVELHSHKLEQILERQRELYLEIDKRIDAVLKRPASSQPDYTAPLADAGPTAGSMSEQEAYDRAVNLILRDKRYDQAIPEFEAFLKAYPTSGFAANARYWLGQLLFNKQDWSGAASHFERVISEFPDSNKRADSLLKLGMIAQNQANLARAQQLYEQVVREYPDSSARKLAEPRLRTLKAN
ncbi:tol-pal system protein YbgF [Bowmanella pacifica]|uniref:Cell division coordinator CpoB n=2 Tax=Bowmanella pacifica TaxID=502051 RepID=A0A917Z5Z8_9ALTE|nr:tol-pal system protein YbgF [Bowmanella pacifica]GGO74913.1 tol-pal system protein YbgF [Bowmanella pacifica]